MQKAFFRHGNHLMKEAGISLQLEQFPVLLSVHAMKSLSQQEIADVILRDKSSVQRSLTALQRKGLLTVAQDATDKRKHIVTVTPEGTALAKKMKLLMRRADEEAFAAFSGDERAKAIQAMRDIADKLEKL